MKSKTPHQLSRDHYLGKIIVDTEFSSKGDYAYYESIDVDYPGFDGVCTAVTLTTDDDGIFLLLLTTTTGVVYVYDNECVIFGEDV